jgi:hypothetical protein
VRKEYQHPAIHWQAVRDLPSADIIRSISQRLSSL